MILSKIYPHRFEVFFFSLLAILFGSLLIPIEFFDSIFSPILFLINLVAGVVLISKSKIKMWFFVLLLVFSSFLLGRDLIDENRSQNISFLRLGIYFSFYVFVAFEVVKQVWNSKHINKNTMFGLVSGYISLGLLGFFLCLTIEMVSPGSFFSSHIDMYAEGAKNEVLMYFSYITLLSVGYGDIIPISSLAQKATVLIGLAGEIYLVVITGIVIGKYLNQLSQKN
jgi:hypothetical protein